MLKVLRRIIKQPLSWQAVGQFQAWARLRVQQHLLRQVPVVRIKPGNAKFFCAPHNYQLARTAILGAGADSNLQFVLETVQPDDLFVDIGANIGLFSVSVAHIVGCSCLAFEANPKTFCTLMRNTLLNNLDPSKFRVFNAALSDSEKTVTVTDRPDGGTNHVVSRNELIDERTLHVLAMRIDWLIEKGILDFSTFHRVFMKVDIERHERFFLQGAKDLISELNEKGKELIMLIEGDRSELEPLLSDLGLLTLHRPNIADIVVINVAAKDSGWV